jgi:hypothetical protein
VDVSETAAKSVRTALYLPPVRKWLARSSLEGKPMVKTIASSSGICSVSAQRIANPPTRMYRLGKPFVAVQFDLSGKGRLVLLPEGAELRVTGPSRLDECSEVTYENQLYSMFKSDLTGPCSDPVLLNTVVPIRAVGGYKGLRPARCLFSRPPLSLPPA